MHGNLKTTQHSGCDRVHASRRTVLGGIGVGALALASASVWTPASATGPTHRKGFDLQGHRGARGLAPENTLAGMRAALAQGVSTLEFDIAISSDGVPILAHDLRLNPLFTRDAHGRWLQAPTAALHSLSLAELQRYDVGRLQPGTPYAQTFPQQQPVDGERMPTLAEVFAAVKRWGATDVRFNIETKLQPREPALTAEPAAFARAVLREIDAAGMLSRCNLQSFDWRTLVEAKRLSPTLALAALTLQGPNFDNVASTEWTAGLRLQDHAGSVPRLVQALGAKTWSPQYQGLSEALVKEAQALGLKVIPWTINDPIAMQRLISLGVDGLITDHPERARPVMAAAGLPLPLPLSAAALGR
jgi:glycerophosphoryl diester phosphodiesterase